MNYIIEIKPECTIDIVTAHLKQMGIKYKMVKGSIVAELTFDQVAELKDQAYCTHKVTNYE